MEATGGHLSEHPQFMKEDNYNKMWDALERTLDEDIRTLKNLVDDSDSACNARHLRRERMMALEYVCALMEVLEGWRW